MSIIILISGQLILSQANLDASIGDLVTRIKQIYEFILENKITIEDQRNERHVSRDRTDNTRVCAIIAI